MSTSASTCTACIGRRTRAAAGGRLGSRGGASNPMRDRTSARGSEEERLAVRSVFEAVPGKVQEAVQ